MRARLPLLLAAPLLLGPGVLACLAGGYFDRPRLIAGIVAWACAAVAALALPAPLPPEPAARAALAGLAALTAWTGLSLAWTPLGGPAADDLQRLLLYLGAFVAALAVLRDARVQPLVEPALLLAITGAVLYGLLARAGALDLAPVRSAGDRLAYPLTYWNATGAFAALGVVLAAGLAGDRARPAALRAAGAAAAAPLLAAVYLTYSRGALAALAVGLLTLVALARPRLRAVALVVLALAASGGAVAVARVERRPGADTPGAGPARLASVQSNRYAYWRVAVRTFAEHPLKGLGSGSFRVAWLRERTFAEPVRDAHSLELETAAELGLAGLAALALLLGGVAAGAVRAGRPVAIAALAVWAFHSALDWDWELPGFSLVAVALGAHVLTARATPSRAARADARAPRARSWTSAAAAARAAPPPGPPVRRTR